VKIPPSALAAALLLGACAQPRSVGTRFDGVVAAVEVARLAAGDDIRWREASWDDSAWPRCLLYQVHPAPSTSWIRARVSLPEMPRAWTPSIYVSIVGSFEVWWDGSRIGSSGDSAADGSVESLGAMDNFYPIPPPLAAAGTHQLAIRVATPPQRFQGIAIGDLQTMLRSRVVSQVVPLAGVGVYAVIAAYCLALFAAGRRRGSLVVFSLLCVCAALLALAESWRWTVGYTADHHVLRLRVVTALTFSVSLLFVTFVGVDLGLRHRARWIVASAAILVAVGLASGGWDERCLALFGASTVLAAIAWVAGRRAPPHRSVPNAIAVGLIGTAYLSGGYGFSDSTFFIAFALVIVSLLASLVLEMRAERRAHEEAVVRATRLELELVRKSVQPHFLMNTLTAVMEWIEDDPPAGLAFLEALADELRLFEEMSHERLVPVAQELALCRTHLTLMECRKRTRFELDLDAVDPAATIPPAVFHTLIENAITHNRYGDSVVVFALRERRTETTRCYVFDAPLGTRPAAERAIDGTGMRYVKARLEESYAGRWSVAGAAFGSSWRTLLEVPA
jgi:hypothetical protein